MPELSSEELERIKLEEIKKIEEIERENREKKLRLQEELKKLQQHSAKAEAAAPPSGVEESDKVREQIRTREMIARGFIQVDGEWISREEAERRAAEKEEQKKIEEEKIARAKQRKIDREKASYEEYRAGVILHLKFYSIIIYITLALFIAGVTMSLVGTHVKSMMSTFFFPGLVSMVAGLVGLLSFIGLLIDAETKLIERSIFDYDNEKHVFQDESEITDLNRRLCRAIARRIHPRLRVEPKKSEDEFEEGDE